MRKGFLKSAMALLAGAGLAVCYPSAVMAGDKVTQVSFEDADQTVAPDGKVAPKVLDASTPVDGTVTTGPAVFGGGGVGPYPGGGGDSSRFWASGEYLLWWFKSAGGPPLVTLGSASDTAPGALGSPGTTLAVASPTLSDNARSGARFTAGWWADCDHTLGFEASYFFFPTQTKTASISSTGGTGTPVIARPFLNATTGVESAELDAFPGVLAGGKVVQTKSFLNGVNGDAILNLTGCNECYRVALVGGFEYLELDESLNIAETTTVLPGITSILPTTPFPFMPGNIISVADRFATRSAFYGGQIGIDGEWHSGGLSIGAFANIGLGDTHNIVDINGSTNVTTPAGAVTHYNSGLLALSSNIGHYSQDKFSVVPDIGVNVGYNVTQRFRVFVGYELLYWTDVVRPGNQIDRTLNTSLVPTSTTFAPGSAPALPRFAFNNSDFWAQGITFGVEFDY